MDDIELRRRLLDSTEAMPQEARHALRTSIAEAIRHAHDQPRRRGSASPRWRTPILIAAALMLAIAGVAALRAVWPEPSVGEIVPATDGPVVTPTAPATRPTAGEPTAVVGLPGGITVQSMSWPTAANGWVVGTPGPNGGRAALYATTDHGLTWRTMLVPSELTDLRQVVFATPDDGWILGDRLLATHDGGQRWQPISPAGTGNDEALAVATDGLRVYAGALSAGDGVQLSSAAIGGDEFTAVNITIGAGAGPVPQLRVSLGGSHGLALVNNRSFVGGAEIGPGGEWRSWDPRCTQPFPVVSAALSPSGNTLVVACAASGFADPGPLLASDTSSGALEYVTLPEGEPSDDGQSARLIWVAATDAGTRVVGYVTAGGDAVIATSADGGQTWSITHRQAADSGFPTTVANVPGGDMIVSGGSPTTNLMSRDGGRTWTALAG